MQCTEVGGQTQLESHNITGSKCRELPKVPLCADMQAVGVVFTFTVNVFVLEIEESTCLCQERCNKQPYNRSVHCRHGAFRLGNAGVTYAEVSVGKVKFRVSIKMDDMLFLGFLLRYNRSIILNSVTWIKRNKLKFPKKILKIPKKKLELPKIILPKRFLGTNNKLEQQTQLARRISRAYSFALRAAGRAAA